MKVVEILLIVLAFFLWLLIILPTLITAFLLWDVKPLEKWNDIMEVSILKIRDK